TIIGSSANTTNDGENATAIGAGASASSTAVAIGSLASSAEQGVAVGNFAQAGLLSTSVGLSAGGIGAGNTAVGYNALAVGEAGNNVAMGSSAMPATITGFNNVGIGAGVMNNNISGSENVAIGTSALGSTLSNNNNVAIGQEAMLGATTANNCTAVGFLSDFTTPNITNSMALGSLSRVGISNAVGIGNTSVTSIGGYEDWTNFSDGRFKTNLQENVPGLAFIQGLRPVTYTLDVHGIRKELGTEDSYLNPEKEHIRYTGFIAQEVEETAQELGYDFSGVDRPGSDADFYGLRYATFVVPLVQAVQEQQDQIEDLQNRVQSQQSMIEQQAALLASFEARLSQLESQ
ncbi:MAG: tail fiber domain-containing protein, partial [Bacteroidota bacterium]